MRQINIALCDSQPVVLEGISAFLSRIGGVCVVGVGKTSEDAVQLFERTSPDVIVLDINLPGDCLAAIKKIASQRCNTKIVVFTASEDAILAVKVLDAGADAYVLKGSSSTEFMQALECTLQGGTYISPRFAAQLVGATRNHREAGPFLREKKLSFRGEQIVGLLLRGKQNREIAAALLLTERTVKGYMTGLMQKLNAKSRLEVVMIMQQRQEATPSGGRRVANQQGFQPLS